MGKLPSSGGAAESLESLPDSWVGEEVDERPGGGVANLPEDRDLPQLNVKIVDMLVNTRQDAANNGAQVGQGDQHDQEQLPG